MSFIKTPNSDYFDQWLIHNYPQLNFFEIDLRIAKNFLDQVSPKYRDYGHGALRQFFRWCLYRKICTENPFEMIAEATTLATGKAIPTRILKMTARHLHVNGADTSLLTQLGWGRQASALVWVPRKFH